jgi:hypothetical protein
MTLISILRGLLLQAVAMVGFAALVGIFTLSAGTAANARRVRVRKQKRAQYGPLISHPSVQCWAADRLSSAS